MNRPYMHRGKCLFLVPHQFEYLALNNKLDAIPAPSDPGYQQRVIKI